MAGFCCGVVYSKVTFLMRSESQSDEARLHVFTVDPRGEQRGPRGDLVDELSAQFKTIFSLSGCRQ